jgi:hypothetical protein
MKRNGYTLKLDPKLAEIVQSMPNVPSSLDRAGAEVQAKAVANVPRKSQRLASSIGRRLGRDFRGPYCEIGSKLDYAFQVEVGTRRRAAEPWLRPALRKGNYKGGKTGVPRQLVSYTSKSGRTSLITQRQADNYKRRRRTAP